MMSDSLYDLSCQKVTVGNDLRILANTFQTLISQSWLNIAGKYWGEWPSGLRRCYQDRKVPGSNPVRCSAGLRDPTSLRGSR